MSIILSMLVNSMVLFLRQFMSIKTSIIVNSMGILFEVEERHVAGNLIQ